MGSLETVIDLPGVKARYFEAEGSTTFSQGGITSGICRIPMGWDDPEFRGGIALDVTGMVSYWGSNDARQPVIRSRETIELFFHKNPGTSIDSLAGGWVRQEDSSMRSFISDFGSAWPNSATFAQRGGKYLYRIGYRNQAGFSAGIIQFARFSGNDTVSWVINQGYARNDFNFFGAPFGIGGSSTEGHVTDHEFPWIWIRADSTIIHFRDDRRFLGYTYRNLGDPTHPIGRVFAGKQGIVTPAISEPIITGQPILVHPWNVSNYGAPELWWFLKKRNGSQLTGEIDIYRSRWMPGQATRQFPAETSYKRKFTDDDSIDLYSEIMSEENPTAHAFEVNWKNADNYVGTVSPGSFWAPAGTAAVQPGITGADPFRLQVLRHPKISNCLTLVMYFTGGLFGGDFTNWNGVLTFYSKDNGRTWSRPKTTPTWDGDGDVSRAPEIQSGVLLDGGRLVVPVERNDGDLVALLAPEAVNRGVGTLGGSDIYYRRSDLDRGAWV